MNCGAVYIVYGQPAHDQARLSVQSLQRAMPELPIVVVTDGDGQDLCSLPFVTGFYMAERDEGGRWAKVNLWGASPFELTAYLDADTRIRESLEAGFRMLGDGWDLAVTPSTCQGERMLWHVGAEDKATALEAWPCEPLQLQGGLMFFRRSETVRAFFAAWREEWERFEDQDQGALLRALARCPVKVWLLGRPWNGGAMVSHLFGRAKRR